MPILIQMIATNDTLFRDGVFLETYNPEAFDGIGEFSYTTNLLKAATFRNMEEALATYRAVPKCRPLRGDGKPNRPMTAFTVCFIEAPVQ